LTKYSSTEFDDRCVFWRGASGGEDMICHVIAVTFREVHAAGPALTVDMLPSLVDSFMLDDRTEMNAAPPDWKAPFLSARVVRVLDYRALISDST
jgi:hypothetical protein